MENEVMVLEQTPIIRQSLKSISSQIEERIAKANEIEATEENRQLLKKERAEIKKDFDDLETKRKALKNKLLEPYNEFEKIYKELISDKCAKADELLKNKINLLEDVLKNKIKDKVVNYFNELLAKENIDFVAFEDAGIKVGLSDSEKSLKEQAKAFVDRIVNDTNTITTLENSNEVLVEYIKNLDLANSIAVVKERHKEISKLESQETKEIDKPLPKVEQLSKPKDITEEKYVVNLKIKGTREQLRTLKGYLDDMRYEYESIK